MTAAPPLVLLQAPLKALGLTPAACRAAVSGLWGDLLSKSAWPLAEAALDQCAADMPVGTTLRLMRRHDIQPSTDFVAACLKLGTTRLVPRPSPSNMVVTAETLYKLLLKDIRQIRIADLNLSIPETILSVAAHRSQCPTDQLTVDGLLNTPFTFEAALTENNSLDVAVVRTREALHDLGFDYFDGHFMTSGRRLDYLRYLVEEEYFTTVVAGQIAAFEQRRGYIHLRG